MGYSMMETVCAQDIQLMEKSTDPKTRRVMDALRDMSVVRKHRPVRVADVPSKYQGAFLRAADRARLAREMSQENDGDAVWDYIRTRLSLYRKNANKRGIPFALSHADIAALYERAGGCCEVTGVAFTVEKYDSLRAPFSPSIDRVDSARGYTIDNVRLTCQLVNLAMNVWGDRVMREFISRAAAVERTKAAA